MWVWAFLLVSDKARGQHNFTDTDYTCTIEFRKIDKISKYSIKNQLFINIWSEKISYCVQVIKELLKFDHYCKLQNKVHIFKDFNQFSGINFQKT